jgi:hypothetical protein
MKTMKQSSGFTSRNSLILAVIVGGMALPAVCSAQQGYGQPSYYGQQGNPDRWGHFYQKGDEISDRVSGFMRRLFKGSQAQRSAYATPAPQYQAPTYYQQPAPAPVTAPSSSVYGYSTPSSNANNSKSVQPATRKSGDPTTPRTSIFTKKTKPKTESAPPPATYKPYQPPQIDNTPPPSKAPEPKFEPKVEPKVDTKFKPKDAPRIDPGLEPGTTVDASGKPSANLGTIITDSPKSTAASTQGDSIPLGKKGSLPTSVYSPYSPYTELDITGMGSGSTVKDPTNGKAFRVP